MRTQTSTKILASIEKKGQVSAHELIKVLGISRTAIHRQLKNLLLRGLIEKKGRPPIVFYTIPSLAAGNKVILVNDLPLSDVTILNDTFLSITPDGKLLYGVKGFEYWMGHYQSDKEPHKIADQYKTVIVNQNLMRNKLGVFDASQKLINTFGTTPISHLFLADMYSYPIFGRTKLAKLVMYSKQVGERSLIDEIVIISRPLIQKVIDKYHLEAVCFVPPTVPRPVQFMELLEKRLRLELPNIEVVKVVPGDIPIPQKTLSTLEERISNARDSFFLRISNVPYSKILLVDDVVGSGASFQEVAMKIKKINPKTSEIIAFGLVGNPKGYEVVREI